MQHSLFIRLLLCVSLLSPLSCGHSPIAAQRPSPALDIQFDDVDQTQSFGFQKGADQYQFAQIKVKNDKYICQYFVGFKNKKLEYSFPADRLSQLSEIYFKNLNIEEKKSRTLAEISKFEKESRNCTKEIAERQMTVADKIETGVYLAFLFPLYLMSAVTFASKDSVEAMKDSHLRRKMDQIRLGMSHHEVQTLMDRPLNKNRLEQYDYYFVDGRHTRLAMYFAKDRLDAYVRGYQYRTQHEAPKGQQQ